MTTGIHNLDHAVHKAREWIQDVQQELHYEEPAQAYRATRAVLQTVRDRLPVNEASDFGAQLPMVIAGVYYSGWHPADKPLKLKTLDEFYDHVHQRMDDEGLDPRHATRGVLKAIGHNMTPGELENVRNNLPDSLKGVIPE